MRLEIRGDVWQRRRGQRHGERTGNEGQEGPDLGKPSQTPLRRRVPPEPPGTVPAGHPSCSQGSTSVCPWRTERPTKARTLALFPVCPLRLRLTERTRWPGAETRELTAPCEQLSMDSAPGWLGPGRKLHLQTIVTCPLLRAASPDTDDKSQPVPAPCHHPSLPCPLPGTHWAVLRACSLGVPPSWKGQHAGRDSGVRAGAQGRSPQA